MPCIFITMVEMATFLLKYNDGDRMQLSCACLLAYSMFEMTIVGELPKSSDNPPFLQIIVTLFMSYISMSILLQAFCVHIASKSKGKNTPSKCLLLLVKGICFCILLPCRFDSSSKDWSMVARCLDRVSVIIVLLLHLATYSSILVFIAIE